MRDKFFEFILWPLKVSKEFIYNDQDVYIAGAYNNSKNLNYAKGYESNVLEILRYQLSKFCWSDIAFIGGDFCSGIGNQPDFLKWKWKKFESSTTRIRTWH